MLTNLRLLSEGLTHSLNNGGPDTQNRVRGMLELVNRCIVAEADRDKAMQAGLELAAEVKRLEAQVESLTKMLDQKRAAAKEHLPDWW